MRVALSVSLLVFPLALFAAFGRAASPPPSCPASATTGAEVEAVRKRELRGARVNIEGWEAEEARGFFAPEYLSIQPDGGVRRLDAVMAAFVDGRSRGWARSFEISALDIHVYHCVAAVVVGVAEVRAAAAPADARPWRIRYLNVWRWQDGQWLNSSNQFARIAEPAGSR